jgi:hypothetical protein
MECTTDSATVAHERLASIAQFFCTLLKSRVFVRESGMQGFVQIHLGAGKTHACQRGHSDRVNEGEIETTIERMETERTSYGP